ncbi:UPF0262 family protein [Acidiphilium sp. C61]|jgi:uncharacterized protein (UPF0262 family)|uniref:UPF0262 family protein n=1 Tax=Acidiphilium sp. C61 TaxID=1671485 RepID=UPI00157B09E4|nr:UPF0262 family protein [Acidiphilium sp. C61]
MADGASDIRGRLRRVVLDEEIGGALSPMQEADRNQAIADLAADNRFALATHPEAATILHLSVQDGRLVFDIRDESDATQQTLVLAPGPFRSMIRDYQMLLDSYAAAVAEGREARIQAIDMGRRGLHNEGAELVMARLNGKVLLDFDTARRLFTLICALHRRA